MEGKGSILTIQYATTLISSRNAEGPPGAARANCYHVEKEAWSASQISHVIGSSLGTIEQFFSRHNKAILLSAQ
jgi:hypothetical protein